MKKHPIIVKIIILSWMILTILSCQKSLHDRSVPGQLFNADWKFIISDDSLKIFMQDISIRWADVTLPHTPVIEPLIVNEQWQGTCWYRKLFNIPSNLSGKKLYLKFDGAMNVAEVWVNGQYLKKHLGGFLPFIVDFTDYIKTNEPNEVLVRLDNTDNEITGPKPLHLLDFNTYGGLYRDVWLIAKNPVHVTDALRDDLPGRGGILVSYPEVSETRARIKIMTNIGNDTDNPQTVSIIHELWKDNILRGVVISNKSIQGIEDTTDDICELEVTDPDLWYPDAPELYELVTRIVVEDEIMDKMITRIGIRRFEITKEHFAINGREMFLRGVNRHQEYPFIGYALSNEAQYRDALKIKEAGFDYVRLSHYPQSPAFMDACDELGLLVLDAIPGWQYFNPDPAFREQVLNTCREMIRRDRNHACVLAWEVSLNESWMPEDFIDQAIAIAHDEYPGDQCFTAGWMEYGYDIYLQARQHRLEHYTEPGKPYIVSEYGDWEYYAMNAGLQQDLWGDLLPEERSSRQLLGSGEVRLLQQATNIQEAHNDNLGTPAFADGYWVMFEYNRGYADDLEASGIMSLFRIPKFSYYFFRSQRDASETSTLYSSGPMVYLATYWDEHSPLNVRVFSNCEEVELRLNGAIISRQKPDNDRISHHLAHPPFTFRMEKFVPGELEVIGFIHGQESASHSVRTPVKPFSLQIRYDKSGKAPRADVKDVIFVYADITDLNGTKVPANNIPVNFSITGDAAIIGDNTTRSRAGTASALLMIGKSAGEFMVKAESEGLEPAILNIPVE